MSLKQKLSWILLICVLYVILTTCTIATYAYFSKKEIYDGYLSGQVELLFDRLNDTGISAYQTALNTEYEGTGVTAPTVDKTATWGTEAYPYVISNVRHLYNLSELQRLGYFYKKFISQNSTTDYSNIPYFLVCTPEYTPALIDGSDFKSITAIGTDAYPFIGSVKGVKNSSSPIDVNGKSCDTSAICNVKVAGNPANVDIGLFGFIGYLGGDITTDANGVQTFDGQISTVSNLVLSDVQVVVNSSAWSAVTAFVEDIMINATDGHRYSFSELYNTDDYNKVPHENHHIGILAGHVSYAKVEFISVYYSADDVVAMDLTDATTVGGTAANYLSATGILGFIYNLNPEFTVDSDGNLTITAGSGDSLGDISYGSVGGGGLASGNNAGYVLASEMYGKYHYYTGTTGDLIEDTTGTIKLKDALDENGEALCVEWVRDRILWGTENTGRYYFYDGVFTFALSDQEDEIEPTWDILVDDDGNPIFDENGYFTYDISGFSIGQNDDAAWQTNTSKGNKAVVAYVKKVTSDSDLQAAIDAGKQIFIMQENQESLFLMSLYEQSTAASSGNFEDKYTTNGTTLKFSDQTLVDSLASAYELGTLKLPTGVDFDMTSDYDTEEKIAAALRAGDLQVINVGISSSTLSLADLKAEYKITPTETGSYAYFVGDTPVSVNADGTIQQYYDYANSGYDGYFYYTATRTSLFNTTYEYYWQPLDSTSESVLLVSGTNQPSTYFNDNTILSETWEGEYVYTYGGYTGVLVNKSDGVFYSTNYTAAANGATLTKSAEQQYFDYADSVYEGYIYYTTTSRLGTTYYTYNWQGKDGSTATLVSQTPNKPETFFTNDNVVGSWQGENVYSYTTDNGTTYTGVVVNKTNSQFYDSGNSVNASGPALYKSEAISSYVYYFYTDINTPETSYIYSGDGGSYDLSQLKDTGKTTPSGNSIYSTSDGKEGVLLDRYPTYTFSAIDKEGNTNFLRMVEAVFNFEWISYGTHYVLWNGTDTEAEKGSNFTHTFAYATRTPSVTNSTNATLRFNADGTCYIQYSIGSTGLYVNSTGTVFNTATSNTGSGTKLCIYTVEGTQDISYGRITFDPIDDSASETDSYTFSAGEYVLVANPTHTGEAGNISATSTDYTVTSLVELNWNNGEGETLSQSDLLSKFEMVKGITFGASFNLLNGTLGSSGIITAPVGTDGVEANIPMACVAFKINKAVEAAKIRVIVSVAVSEFYIGEDEYELGDYTRFFNLWKMEAAGESVVQIFNATGSNLIDRFEVPRSHPYEPGTTAGASNSEYIMVNYNGNTYRCYLNGDRVLIAYEFTVNTTDAGTGTGVYCLGMSGLDADGNSVSDVPMEIVYFSADGVASVGRDGATGSQIGTIDFVYDYNNTIVTVTASSSTDEDGKEDYSTYYPSYCLLYFNTNEHASDYTDANPTFLPVNNEAVAIRRTVESTASSDANHNTTDSLSTLTFKLNGGDKRVKVVQYSRVSDNVQEQT